MAIFHLHVKNISRSDGRSAVAAAAYRAGESLANEREERESAFGGRRDVRHAEILLPEGAPDRFADRAILWNAAEAAELRKDARLAKEIECALPRELPLAGWIAVARDMAAAYLAEGHIVDFAIHEDGRGVNPHLHLLLTTRALEGDGFGAKMRAADGKAFVRAARARWAAIINAALAGAGVGAAIDARSHAARGLEAEPGRHRGPDRAERRAKRAERPQGGDMDRETRKAREELLRDEKAVAAFPLLLTRTDWPPRWREPHPAMSAAERVELTAFWRAVDARMAPDRTPGADMSPAGPTILERAEDRLEAAANSPPTMVERLASEAVENARERLSDLGGRVAAFLAQESQGARNRREAMDAETAARQLAEARSLILALRAENEEMRRASEAVRAQYPTRSWEEADRRASDDDPDRHPVPDPDGRPIAPSRLEAAQDAMRSELEQPARTYPTTPRPERMPAGERRAAEDAALRASLADARDPELEWLTRPPDLTAQPADRRDPETEWLRLDENRRRDRDGPERDRDR